ncbi:MAG: hypothetical protein ACT4OY_04905 [Alphaproteobacteria bacterium]
MPKTDPVTFSDNPAVSAAADPGKYVEIMVSAPKVLESWRLSLFSYEWLDGDGRIKPLEALPAHEQHKRLNAETLIRAGQPLIKPVLGIGILDNVEIGSGRAEFMTLAARGVTPIPVHIPRSNLAEFKPFMDRGSERGNILFYILIAVAMLAALSYAVSQSGRGNLQQLSEDKIKLYAAEILEYANTITNAVSQLHLRGCKDTEISFENAIVAGYENAGAPSDKSCNVFNAAGGGAHWKVMQQEFLGDHAVLDSIKGDVEFTGMVDVVEVGTDDGDLLMQIDLVKKEICMKMNEMLSIENEADNAPEDALLAIVTTAPFIGAYVVNTNKVIGDDSQQFRGKTAGCRRIEHASEGAYFFYKVLRAR